MAEPKEAQARLAHQLGSPLAERQRKQAASLLDHLARLLGARHVQKIRQPTVEQVQGAERAAAEAGASAEDIRKMRERIQQAVKGRVPRG